MPKLSFSPARRAPCTTSALLFTLLAACGTPSAPSTDEPLRAPNVGTPEQTTSPDRPSATFDRADLRDVISPESEGLLPRLGIASTEADALTADEEAASLTVVGALGASCDAPVAMPDGSLEALGTATVTVDGVQLALASGVLLDASADDVAYAVLFDPDMPSTWVVVAAQTAALQDGAVLSLDGLTAAAVVLDENTGDARLALGGDLTVTSADLAVGGSLVANLSSDLVAVDLDSWPADLFPLAGDPPADLPITADATVTGTFSVVFLGNEDVGDAPRTVAITAEAEGFAPLVPTAGYAYAQSDGSHTLAFVDDGGRMIAIVAPAGAFAASGTLTFDNETIAAWWVEADGSAWFYDQGALTLDTGAAAPGEHVSGSVAIAGTLTYAGNL